MQKILILTAITLSMMLLYSCGDNNEPKSDRDFLVGSWIGYWENGEDCHSILTYTKTTLQVIKNCYNESDTSLIVQYKLQKDTIVVYADETAEWLPIAIYKIGTDSKGDYLEITEKLGHPLVFRRYKP